MHSLSSRLASSLHASTSSAVHAGMAPRRARRSPRAGAVAAPLPPTMPWHELAHTSTPLQLRSPLPEPVASVTSNATAAASAAAGTDADPWALQTGLALTWLGTSSASPTLMRNVSCTLLRLPHSFYLVDCGEGTHRQLQRTGIDPAEAEAILITHLHGDHCFGLGSTLALLTGARARARGHTGAAAAPQQQQQQQQQLRVVGPPGVAELLRAMLMLAGGEGTLAAPVEITELVMTAGEAHGPRPVGSRGLVSVSRLAPTPAPPAPADALARLARARLRPLVAGRDPFRAAPGLVWTLPTGNGGGVLRAAQLQHRVPCWGYCLDEAAPAAAGGPTADGAVVPGAGRRVVVLGDTMDSSALAPLALGADVVAHEATFMAGMEALAARAQHSTAWMAGEFAAAVGARSLVLTHFSGRYVESDVGRQRGGERGEGGGGRGQRAEPQEEDPAVGAAEQAAAVASLVEEAEGRFRGGPVFAAKDFWTFHVPARGDEAHAAAAAEGAAAAAAAAAAGSAAWAALQQTA